MDWAGFGGWVYLASEFGKSLGFDMNKSLFLDSPPLVAAHNGSIKRHIFMLHGARWGPILRPPWFGSVGYFPWWTFTDSLV